MYCRTEKVYDKMAEPKKTASYIDVVG